MCPFCFATAAMIVGSVASTGGLAAIAIRKFGMKSAVDDNPVPIPTELPGEKD